MNTKEAVPELAQPLGGINLRIQCVLKTSITLNRLNFTSKRRCSAG
mgnify:CR=1 FL=1